MNDNDTDGTGRDGKSSSKLGPAGIFTIALLVGFLLWSLWYAVHSWNQLEGIDISGTGWVFIVIGVLMTVALGAGLMALVFYSSRKDYDR